MPRTLAQLTISKDMDEWIEEYKKRMNMTYSQIQRDAIRVAMEKDKRKNK